MKIKFVKTQNKTSLQFDPLSDSNNNDFTPLFSVCCYKLVETNYLIAPSIATAQLPPVMDGSTAKRYSLGLSFAASIVDRVADEYGLEKAYQQLKHSSLINDVSSQQALPAEIVCLH